MTMTTTIKTAITVAQALPTFAGTDAERRVRAIAALRGWWRASIGIDAASGFRWRDMISSNAMRLYRHVRPDAAVGPNGAALLRFGYGLGHNGTDRGALRPSSQRALIDADGFTVFSVIRLPTVAEQPNAGGYIWASRGPNVATTPGLRISSSTGRPLLRGGGIDITSNPPAIDLRDGALHILRATWAPAAGAGVLRINVDRNRASQAGTGAITPPSSAIANMFAPFVGVYMSDAGVYTYPLYGDVGELLFFAASLDAAEIAAVEDLLAAHYGIALIN